MVARGMHLPSRKGYLSSSCREHTAQFVHLKEELCHASESDIEDSKEHMKYLGNMMEAEDCAARTHLALELQARVLECAEKGVQRTQDRIHYLEHQEKDRHGAGPAGHTR